MSPVAGTLATLLARLPRYLAQGWHADADGRQAWFGDPTSGEDGIRGNANVAFAAAVAGTRWPELGLDAAAGAKLREAAAAIVRYLAASHVGAGGRTASGGRWGLEWQSAWWAAKLGLAAQRLGDALDDTSRRAVLGVIVAEADRQLGRIVPTGLFADTKAEENAWDAEVLGVAIALAPSHANAARWRDALIDFAANTFSSPHDRLGERLLDGVPVRERVHTCNVHGDFSLENHGTYHFCYVASPLLSKAWTAYALEEAGQPRPQSLDHGVAEVWALARETFLGHRFAYVGGQDWARYAYGESFIVPALVHLARTLGDGAALAMLEARLATLAGEAAGNDDGSFFGRRVTGGRRHGQHGKYETDAFACLALAFELLRQGGGLAQVVQGTTPRPLAPSFVHVGSEGQFCVLRAPAFFFSFAWNTLEAPLPNACLVPSGGDDLAEWHAGSAIGTVALPVHSASVGVRAMRETADGLAIRGTWLVRNGRGRPLLERTLEIDVDRAAGEVRVRVRAVALDRLLAVVVTGVAWRFPNDLFNGHVRRLRHAGGELELATPPGARDAGADRRRSLWTRALGRLGRLLGRDASEALPIASRWLNVDDRLGIVVRHVAPLVVRRDRARNASGASLYVEQVESPPRRFVPICRPGTTLLDTEIVLAVGSAVETAALAERAGSGG